MTKFSDFQLNEVILHALEKKGYSEPTKIQAQAIPLLLEGRDLIGIAQTGTGKTGAFSLAIIDHISKTKRKVKPIRMRALVLTPTRELAAQIHESFRDYGKGLGQKIVTLTGGMPKKKQFESLLKGCDIVVATPGRLLEFIYDEKILFDELEFLVLDEADRMLDMGFITDVNKILKELPKEKQSILFSATMPSEISSLASELLSSPARVEVERESTVVEGIDQKIYWVHPKLRLSLLQNILKRNSVKKCIVFTQTKIEAKAVSAFLESINKEHTLLHGDKTQGERDYALRHFKKDSVKVLVATDVAARGIDISDITHVINIGLPENTDNYIHRIGRTARASATGVAISLCDESNRSALLVIEESIGIKIPIDEDHKFHGLTPKDLEPKKAKHKKKKK